MHLRALGPLEAESATGPLDLGGLRQRSVLARLAVARHEVVSVDRLLDDLWDGEPPPRALGSLQAFVSNLRRALEPDRPPRTPATLLVSRPPGYQLGPVLLDVDSFEAAVADGTRELAEGRPAAAIRCLDSGLGLWRGQAYAEYADTAWALPEVTRLTELRTVAREHRLAALLAAGDAGATVPGLETLTREQPLRETLWRLLALALYRTGRQADALGALRTARDLLADELGLDPSPALRQLESQLLAQAAELEWTPPREAVTTLPATHTPPPPVTDDVPLGRRSAAQTLLAAAHEAAAGAVRYVVVSGEPGIGKTHLADWLTRRLHDEGWLTAWSRCPEAEGVPAYWPWQQLLDVLGGALPTRDEAVADAAEARFRQHDAVASYLAQVSAERPALLVVDDVQWADRASLRLLLDVAGLQRGGRLLVLLTARAGEVNADLADAFGHLGRRGATRLELAGFGADDVGALAHSRGLDVTDTESRLLADRTGGNPFFLAETLLLAASEGRSALEEGVSPTVQDVLRRRLGRLPEATTGLLATAAVLGRDVDLDLLLAVSQAPEDEVLDALDAATVAGVLAESGAGRVRFCHDLIRETLAAGLGPLRRARTHARAAAALELAGGDPAAVAFHALAAGPPERDRALRAAVGAARAAVDRLAFDDASRWYATAADLARQTGAPAEDLVQLLLALVRVQLDAGEWVQARQTRVDALRAADTAGRPELAMAALVALDTPTIWTLHSYAEIDLDIVARLESAVAATSSEDSELRARLLATLAMELYDGTDDPRCDGLSREAIVMARRLNDARLLAFCLFARYQAIHQPRFARDQLAVAEELVQLGRAHALPATELMGHETLAVTRLLLFDVAGADAATADAEVLLRRLALPPANAIHRVWVAARICAQGRFDEAAEAYVQGFQEQRALGFFSTDPLECVCSGVLDLLRGDWPAVADRLESLDALLPQVGAALRISYLAATGSRAEARELADAQQPYLLRDWALLAQLVILGEAGYAAGSVRLARFAYDELLPYSGWLAVGGTSLAFGPVDYYLGCWAQLLDGPAARGFLERAQGQSRARGLPFWAAQATAELARLAATSRSQVVR